MNIKHDRIVVVIGDIVKSSRYSAEDRRLIQEKLKESWQTIRGELEISDQSSFGISGGDEFEIICPSFDSAFQSVFFMRLDLKMLNFRRPVVFRASIAIGDRYVRGGSNPYSHDGPVFGLARENIKRFGIPHLRKLSHLAMEHLKRDWAHLTTLGAGSQDINEACFQANHFLPVMDCVYNRWSVEQASAIAMTRRGRSLSEIAEEFSVSESAISQRLDRSNWESYVRGMYGIIELIDKKLSLNA